MKKIYRIAIILLPLLVGVLSLVMVVKKSHQVESGKSWMLYIVYAIIAISVGIKNFLNWRKGEDD